jgi:lipopolysaccharide transport system ATP-binding protein
LLELGAGFNPDFTGRENALLNGVLMGIPEKEMKWQMPRVENFADIGEYFDQPVKFYSSGMFVRLAFASAVHVNPDILVVDEALAVGDAKFQFKCFQKFHEFRKEGKTVLLVAHDMNIVSKLCDEVVLLNEGLLLKKGDPKDVINYYVDLIEGRNNNPTEAVAPISSANDRINPKPDNLSSPAEELTVFMNETPVSDKCPARRSYNKNEYHQSGEKAQLVDYLIIRGEKCDPVVIDSGDHIDRYLKAKFNETVHTPLFGFAIKSLEGVLILGFNTFFAKTAIPPANNSDTIIYKFSIRMNLSQGDYFIDLGVDEKTNAQSIASLDRRCAVIHLSVQGNCRFEGLVGLETSFQEVSRNGEKVEGVVESLMEENN